MKLSLATAMLLAALVFAGCGGNIEDQVRSEYGAYAERHDTPKDIDHIKCVEEPTRQYDGWCLILNKGVPEMKALGVTFDVPYRDNELLWGEAGLGKVPASLALDAEPTEASDPDQFATEKGWDSWQECMDHEETRGSYANAIKTCAP